MKSVDLKSISVIMGLMWVSLASADMPSYQVPAPLVQPAAQVGKFTQPSVSTQRPPYVVPAYTRGQTTLPNASPRFPGVTPVVNRGRPNPNGSPQLSSGT